jgi:hypothetical protein
VYQKTSAADRRRVYEDSVKRHLTTNYQPMSRRNKAEFVDHCLNGILEDLRRGSA